MTVTGPKPEWGTGVMDKKFSALVSSILIAAFLTGCVDEPANTTVTEKITVPESAVVSESTTATGSVQEPVYEAVNEPGQEYGNRVSEASIYGSGGFTLKTDGEAFTNDELLELAKKRYSAFVGRLTEFVEIDRVSGDIVYIRFYENYYQDGMMRTYTEDLYKVDRKTGVGTDIHGRTIDLTAFI